MTRRSLFLPGQWSGCQRLLCLGLDLRDQLLEVRPAAEGVEVWLLQLAGKGPTDLDGIRGPAPSARWSRTSPYGRYIGLCAAAYDELGLVNVKARDPDSGRSHAGASIAS